MDHSTSTSQKEDPSIPPAVLASSLLSLPDDQPAERLLSHLEPLDRLTGGLRYGTRTRPGELVGVCIEKTSRSNLSSSLLHSLLASHLTAIAPDDREPGRAFYIDATGNFSPRLLYETVRKRLLETAKQHTADLTRENLEQRASTLLDNVSCMRVLDPVGLGEAVAEIRQELMPKVDSRDKWRHKGVVSDSQAVADSQDDVDLLSLSNMAESGLAKETGDQQRRQPDARGPPLVLLAHPLSLLTTLQHSKGIVHYNARLVSLFQSLRDLTNPPVGACLVVIDSSFDAVSSAVAARPLDLSLTLALDRDRRGSRTAWRLQVAKDRRSDRQGRQIELFE